MHLSKNFDDLHLSIIIVNWNSWRDLINCINSIKESASNINYEIIVVDNFSTDNSVLEIKKLFADITLIENNKNIGFPAANNQAFRIAKGKFLLALNPDTLVKKNTLQESIRILNDDISIGCIGVKTLKENGEILNSCARTFPTLWSTLCHLFYLDTIFKKSKFHNSSEMPYWDHNNSCDIDLLHGGYMMFPSNVYQKIGGFDEKIPMFYEDIEFCCRVKKYGYRNYYLADVEIIHLVGRSIAKAEPSWISGLYCDANYFYFLEYGGGRFNAILYILMIIITIPVRIVYSPFIWGGYFYMKKKPKNILLINKQILASGKWAFNKIISLIK
jgi:GT2 family glycosyltransferase